MKSFGFRCGYMAGNRSRFSKYFMTGSPVFSINFSNQSIKNSQAIMARRNGFLGGIFCLEYPSWRSEKGYMFILQTTDSHFANYRFSFRKLQIFISQTTDSHFVNYRFPFRKLQISISQTTDSHFVSSHFVSQTTVSRLKVYLLLLLTSVHLLRHATIYSEYRANTCKLVRSFCRTRHTTMEAFVIQWYGNKWPCILYLDCCGTKDHLITESSEDQCCSRQ